MVQVMESNCIEWKNDDVFPIFARYHYSYELSNIIDRTQQLWSKNVEHVYCMTSSKCNDSLNVSYVEDAILNIIHLGTNTFALQ